MQGGQDRGQRSEPASRSRTHSPSPSLTTPATPPLDRQKSIVEYERQLRKFSITANTPAITMTPSISFSAASDAAASYNVWVLAAVLTCLTSSCSRWYHRIACCIKCHDSCLHTHARSQGGRLTDRWTDRHLATAKEWVQRAETVTGHTLRPSTLQMYKCVRTLCTQLPRRANDVLFSQIFHIW